VECIAKFTHHKSDLRTTTCESLQLAARSQADVIAKDISVWTRKKLPAAEIVACIVNAIFDESSG
jgi:hypothetical protein